MIYVNGNSLVDDVLHGVAWERLADRAVLERQLGRHLRLIGQVGKRGARARRRHGKRGEHDEEGAGVAPPAPRRAGEDVRHCS